MPAVEVYTLERELAQDPDQVPQTHALTLDPGRPTMGLKGRYGLFATATWWENIRSGAMPVKRRSGVIQRVYAVGQDAVEAPNEVEILTDDGVVATEGIYANSPADLARYRPGERIEILYALDPLKAAGPDGREQASAIALSVKIGS